MNKAIATVALLAGLAVSAASANDVVLLDPDNLANAATWTIEGMHNVLTIDQSYAGPGAGNAVAVEIVGDRNGGPAGAVFTGPVAAPGMAPGRVLQSGAGNAIGLDVRGSDNLFAVAQIGNNNTVRGIIIGHANQASVMQTGNGNFASFTQNGIGNMVSVRQHSW